MNFLSFAIPAGLALFAKYKKGKAAYDLGIQLEGVRLVKWNTGYATLGVKFRLTNTNNTPVQLINYAVDVNYMETQLANGAGNLDITVPANGQAFVEFQVNTANYSAGLLSLLQDLFSGADRSKIVVNYCVQVKGLPKYCDKDIYQL